MKLVFVLVSLFAFNFALASSVSCYQQAINLKDFNQDQKSKQAFAYNLCKGSEDTYPITCYEEFLTLPDYILPTTTDKHFTALTMCRGATKTKISPMNCFLEAIKLPIAQTVNHKSPVEFAIQFCKAKHQYL